MVGVSNTRWSSGQATVEHVGLALVLALLFGALGTWAVREFRPPSAPPPVIARVTEPLFGGAAGAATESRAGTVAGASPVSGVRGLARAMERVGTAATSGADGATADRRSVVGRVWDGFLWWGALNVDGQIEAGKGFLEQIGVRADDLVKDPVKTVEGAIDRLSKPPVTSTADRVARIVRALSGIGDRPFRESFLGISRDLGGLGADWLIAKFARGAGEVLGKLVGG